MIAFIYTFYCHSVVAWWKFQQPRWLLFSAARNSSRALCIGKKQLCSHRKHVSKQAKMLFYIILAYMFVWRDEDTDLSSQYRALPKSAALMRRRYRLARRQYRWKGQKEGRGRRNLIKSLCGGRDSTTEASTAGRLDEVPCAFRLRVCSANQIYLSDLKREQLGDAN